MTSLSEAPAPYRTRQEFAYRRLRDAIMRCELAPGQRLVIDDIARRVRVSAMRVREASQRFNGLSWSSVLWSSRT